MRARALWAVREADALLARMGPLGRSTAAAARTVARRRRHRFDVDADGDWVNTQADGVIVSPAPHRSDLRTVRAIVRDYWFARYTPRPGDTVIDVGAGIGEDTLVFDECVGPTGKVLAIEAHPRTYACLKKTVDRNRLASVTPVHVAVADAPGTMTISDGADHLGNSIRAGEAAPVGMAVPSSRLDAIMEEHGVDQVHLLKMNIEGAERLAIRGLGDAIDRVRNVAIACHDFVAQNDGDDWFVTSELVRAYLVEHGFAVTQRVNDPRPWIRYTLYGVR